ncbi:MAG: cytochrome c3 family protein, partial [Syntrophaceae bacterium]|nr:cytochrome c3 family protein [Syntrophaceae bacterium]
MACFLIFVSALIIISYRQRNPEWKKYQLKGVSLAISLLDDELAREPTVEKQRTFKTRIMELKNIKPRIIETSPFSGKAPSEFCLTCHFGIEDTSESHPNSVFGCVICHGGVGSDLTVKGAHRGLIGGANPARLDLASQSCGSGALGPGMCHADKLSPILDRVRNTPRSIMATNAGIIGILRFQWGVTNIGEERYAIKSVSDGKHELEEIGPDVTKDGDIHLAESHFRKFCSTCHLWGKQPEEKMGRLDGCAACHAIYDRTGRYHGGDPTVNRYETGHASYHSINTKISDERCRACHNRSARTGLNYHGEMESEQYGTPFMNGFYNNRTLSDDRFVLNLVPDIHFEKKMGCVDCHTAQETMGDGKIYGRMKDQVEIRCEDCHGGYDKPPVSTTVDMDDQLTVALIHSSKFIKISEDDQILRTSKGRPLPHIRKTEKGFALTSKLTGKESPVKIITGDKYGHNIKGHERLECDACHSAWSPQCYGCHQILNLGIEGQ